ncbi:hypothetical protein [Amedibacillus sp. YH-ame10]
MSEKEKLISRLELFSTLTFWASSIAGAIVLLMGLNACSAVNEFNIDEVSSTLKSVVAFFIFIVIILTACGITVSYIAKAIALNLRESENMEYRKNTSVIKDMKSAFISSNLHNKSNVTDEHDPLNI